MALNPLNSSNLEQLALKGLILNRLYLSMPHAASGDDGDLVVVAVFRENCRHGLIVDITHKFRFSTAVNCRRTWSFSGCSGRARVRQLPAGTSRQARCTPLIDVTSPSDATQAACDCPVHCSCLHDKVLQHTSTAASQFQKSPVVSDCTS